MFANRTDAGRQLAGRLAGIPRTNLVVLGLPRGGVPVAFEIADALGVPLDVIVVRKLGVPFQPELAMGAIGEDGVRIVNKEVVRLSGVSGSQFAAVEAHERLELSRRAARFRGPQDRVSLAGSTALVVDDGIATGSTVRAACEVARAHGAARVILASPIAPPGAIAGLRAVADEIVVLASPESFHAIGEFYDDFTQTSDDEVIRLLERARARVASNARGDTSEDSRGRDEEVLIEDGPVHLAGHLTIPEGARAIVVFAHGSGSSRHSSRNRFVADTLNRAGLGTLLLDLLTIHEERDRGNVFDVELLAQRLIAATRWLRGRPEAHEAKIGYFAASTGAAAALWASTDPALQISAVVSRGGRPDLAAPRLGAVRAPTLLIVGGNDDVVVDLNRRAQSQLRCESTLRIVPGATHLFEEPGTLAIAAELARNWFVRHMAPARLPEPTTGPDRHGPSTLGPSRSPAHPRSREWS